MVQNSAPDTLYLLVSSLQADSGLLREGDLLVSMRVMGCRDTPMEFFSVRNALELIVGEPGEPIQLTLVCCRSLAHPHLSSHKTVRSPFPRPCSPFPRVPSAGASTGHQSEIFAQHSARASVDERIGSGVWLQGVWGLIEICASQEREWTNESAVRLKKRRQRWKDHMNDDPDVGAKILETDPSCQCSRPNFLP
jgi:hypothetical protein